MSSISLGDDYNSNSLEDHGEYGPNTSTENSNFLHLQDNYDEYNEALSSGVVEGSAGARMVKDYTQDKSINIAEGAILSRHSSAEVGSQINFMGKNPQSGEQSVYDQADSETSSYHQKNEVPEDAQSIDKINSEVGFPERNSPTSKISAYARLDFENYTFFLQTLQVVLGRKSQHELSQGTHNTVDVHLSSKKAISRRHAKIFYNFGTQRFELSIIGRNGAFINDMFVEKGITVPLQDGSKIQIGNISFSFVLPYDAGSMDENNPTKAKPFNPVDAINLRSNIYQANSRSISNSPTPSAFGGDTVPELTIQAKATTSVQEAVPARSRRRLSSIRRTPFANATSDEINHILKDLSALDSNHSALSDAAIESDIHTPIYSSERNPQNQQEYTNAYSGRSSTDSFQNVDVHISELENEIQSLAPLLDQKDKNLTNDQFKATDDSTFDAQKSHNRIFAKETQAGYTMHDPQGIRRTGPLMGKPATPRMGKPASIQPSVTKYYSRQIGLPPKSRNDAPYSGVPSIAGLPTHLVVQGANSGLALKLAEGSTSHLLTNSSNKNLSQYPLPPTLNVTVNAISTDIPRVASRDIPITICGDIKLPPINEPKLWNDSDLYQKLIKRKKEKHMEKKVTKSGYTIDEIPEHFRTKPSLTYLSMVMNILKTRGESDGMTVLEITEAIKTTYPYYNYCPDGWQLSVNHIVSLSKIFKKSTKKSDESGWTWTIDREYIEERERTKSKLKDIADARAKEATMRSEELRLKHHLDKSHFSLGLSPRGIDTPYGVKTLVNLSNGSDYTTKTNNNLINAHKPKSIAELASEIRRDGYIGSKAPLYFKPSSVNQSKENPVPSIRNSSSSHIINNSSSLSIKDQLQSNRSVSSTSSSTVVDSQPANQKSNINENTKNSLAYLQKELFNLYKARNLSFDMATTTELITKALTTTITQVNVIGSKAGCGDNALSFLVEKAPQQVSRILDIALTKVIKEKQAEISKKGKDSSTVKTTDPATSSPLIPLAQDKESHKSYDVTHREGGNTSWNNNSNLSSTGLQEEGSSLSPQADESSYTSIPASPSKLSRPLTFSKPPGVLKPPQFVSSKIHSRPTYHSSTRPTAFSSNKEHHNVNEGQDKPKSNEEAAVANGTDNLMKRPINDIGSKDKSEERQHKVAKIIKLE